MFTEKRVVTCHCPLALRRLCGVKGMWSPGRSSMPPSSPGVAGHRVRQTARILWIRAAELDRRRRAAAFVVAEVCAERVGRGKRDAEGRIEAAVRVLARQRAGARGCDPVAVHRVGAVVAT